MESHEVLKFIDELMYMKTGKRLNNLQREIITGILNKQKYADIAETYGCSHGHAKDVGYELLQMLTEIFGEAVDKNNLKSVLERQGNLNIYFGDRNSINSNNLIGCVNFGSEQPNSTPDTSQSVTPDFQQNKNNQIKQEKINRLRHFGLTDEQIAEVLELPLEVIKWVEMKE